jgi:succinoglycan biosynthesis transport protein ExoP
MNGSIAATLEDHRTVRSDLKVVHELLRGGWAPFLAVVVAVLAATAAYLILTPPKYEAETVLLVQSQDLLASDKTNQPAPPEFVRSELDVIQSRPVIDRVIERMGLDRDPEFGGGQRTDGVWPLTTVEDRFSKRLSVDNDGRSYVIRVKFRSKDPRKAAAIANMVADEYVNLERTEKVQSLRAATQDLTRKVEELRDRALRAEAAAEAFRRKAKLVTVSSDPDSPAEDRALSATSRELLEVSREKADLDAQSAQANAHYDIQSRQIGAGRGTSTSEVVNSPLIGQLRNQEADLARDEASLLAKYKPDHPLVQPVAAALAQVRQASEAESARIHEVVRAQSDAARRSDALLAGVVSGLNQKVDDQISAALKLRDLEADARIQRNLYEEFAAQAGRVAERVDIQLPNALLVSRASTPMAPAEPKKLLVLIGGMVAGLLGGLSAAVVAAALRARLAGPAEATRITGLELVWACDEGGAIRERLEGPSGRSTLVRMTAKALSEARGRKPVLICIVTADGAPRHRFSDEWAAELGRAGAAVLLVAGRHGSQTSVPSAVIKTMDATLLSAAVERDPSFDGFRQAATGAFDAADFVIVETAADDLLLPALAATFDIHLCLLLVRQRYTTKQDARAASRRLAEMSLQPSGLVMA